MDTNFNDIHAVKDKTPYSKVINYVDFVVKNSFGSDGKYHEYLKDYATAVAVITMYTNCEAENFAFDDIMEFRNTDKWIDITDELGKLYDRFVYYVNTEIDYINTPLRFADDLMKNINAAVAGVNELIGAIDINALKGYDYSKITNALEKLQEAAEAADGVEKDETIKPKRATRGTSTKKPNLSVVK